MKEIPWQLDSNNENDITNEIYLKDIIVDPGDRANTCGGGMEPIRVEPDARKGYIIIHRCTKCGEIHRNRAAHEAKIQPDSIKLLIKLTAGIQ